MGKIANFKKKNKEIKGTLQDLFIKDAIMLEDAMEAISEAINAFCNKNNEIMEKFSKKTIEIEDLQDKCRDEIISRIFGKESMVFSRPDRMRMVTAMDRIVGQAKKTAHDLLFYTPENIPRTFCVHIKSIGEKTSKMGVMTRKLMNEFFHDFDEAIETCIKLNEARKGVRERKSDFFKELYIIKPEYYDFHYYIELVNNMTEVCDRMEHFADFIYGLIAKYSTF